ncbi:unnamed protein product [Pleuronectes platessa]|uniref:Uncharacterized protein n=1 Tax=Pleuronectes platessa TaxID=8262 RepID=A0A9N7VIC5_PLEPL|nr:unnamed protein product [Pleuronectes platessa]
MAVGRMQEAEPPPECFAAPLHHQHGSQWARGKTNYQRNDWRGGWWCESGPAIIHCVHEPPRLTPREPRAHLPSHHATEPDINVKSEAPLFTSARCQHRVLSSSSPFHPSRLRPGEETLQTSPSNALSAR